MRHLVSTTLLAALLAATPALADTAATSGDSLAPISGDQWTRAAAAHLLRRAGFGGSPEEIDALHARGLDGAIAYLVDYDKVPNEQVGPFVPIQHISMRSHMRSKVQEMGRRPNEDEARKMRQEYRRKDYAQIYALKSWWIARMARTNHPLEERLTLFWHNHFTSGHRDVRNSYHMLMQNALLRRHAAGNFRAFCKAISRDPAMLEYLDNRTNRKQHPNENFARELMELFTLGVGNYTEKDIKEAARAFTGWTFVENEFVNRRFWHDFGPKTILGKTARYDGDQVIDLLLSRPSASRYIAGKIFRYFAHSSPSEAVVEGLAKTLREGNWEIKPVLRTLFRSQEFYGKASVGTQIKSPISLLVGTMRTLELDPSFAVICAGMSDKLGQSLFNPPNVKGWPGGRDWITTSLLLERYNAAQTLVASPRELQFFGRRMQSRLRRFQQILKNSPGMDPDAMMSGGRAGRRGPSKMRPANVASLIAGCKDAGAVVDRLCATMLATPASPALKKRLAAKLQGASAPFPTERIHGLLKLIVSTPEFQIQ